MVKMEIVPESQIPSTVPADQRLIMSLKEAKNEANAMLNAERVRHQEAIAKEEAFFADNTHEIEYVIRFLDKRIMELEKPVA